MSGPRWPPGVGDADGTTDGAELTSASEAGGLDDAAPESIPEAPAASSRTSTRPPSAAAEAIIRLLYVLSRTPATAVCAAGATVSVADVAAGSAATTGPLRSAERRPLVNDDGVHRGRRLHPEDRTRADHPGRGRRRRGVRLSSQAPLLGDEGRSQGDRVLRIRIDRDRTIRRLADHLGNQRDP